MNLTLELSPEREAALYAKAQARGMSVEQWLLDLAEQLVPPSPVSQEGHERGERPFWENIADSMKDVPPEDLALLPKDGASQIDHYLYGHPKRDR